MLKKLFLISALVLSLTAPPAASHPGGHGGVPILEGQAMFIATQVAAFLVENDAGLGFGKLPQSWGTLADDAVAVHTKGDGYWIVSVRNASEGRTLYVLMSGTGDVYDANFTGKFEGVN